MSRTVFILFACLALTMNIATARIIRVPSEYRTIQAGIDAADNGDTVLVADRLYTGLGNRDLDFRGKAILLTSKNGPEVTIIDCHRQGSGFYFHCDEDTSSVVQGFTIIYSEAYYGAVVCDSSSPTIRGNIITRNRGRYGAGIYCGTSSAIIEDNIITRNRAFHMDRLGGWGGGIYLGASSGATIRGNVIADNIAEIYGGGICCYASSSLITGNTITGNTSFGTGGGIHFRNWSVSNIESNIISDNWAGAYGGGIFCDWSLLALYRNTIVGNLSYRFEGGGISCHERCSVFVFNCILWADSAGAGENHEIYVEDETCEVVVSYSDIEGGWQGEGNIDDYPKFLFPGKEDFRLRWASPCIDSGHPDSLDPDDSRSDIGAFYFDQSKPITIYLTPKTTVVHRYWNMSVTYTLINIKSDPLTFSLQTDVCLPSGRPYPGNPVVGPDEITLPSGKTKQQQVKHYIPSNAPFGTYVYTTTINSVQGNEVINEDSFEFEVVEY